MMPVLDQAAGLRQLFGESRQRVGVIDCLHPPLALNELSQAAQPFGLGFVDVFSDAPASGNILFFEATEAGVLAAYAQLKTLAPELARRNALHAWSRTPNEADRRLIDNLRAAAQHFLGLAIDYRGVIDDQNPAAMRALAAHIAGLLDDNVAKTQQRARPAF